MHLGQSKMHKEKYTCQNGIAMGIKRRPLEQNIQSFSTIATESNKIKVRSRAVDIHSLEMANSNKLIVLKEFRPILRALKAYNLENFHQTDRRQLYQNICYSVGSFIGTILIISFSVLGIWYLFDIHAGWHEFFVYCPLIAGSMHISITWLGLTATNVEISEAIDQLQNVIDQREFM